MHTAFFSLTHRGGAHTWCMCTHDNGYAKDSEQAREIYNYHNLAMICSSRWQESTHHTMTFYKCLITRCMFVVRLKFFYFSKANAALQLSEGVSTSTTSTTSSTTHCPSNSRQGDHQQASVLGFLIKLLSFVQTQTRFCSSEMKLKE